MTQEIKEAKYEGYLWLSDQSKPEVLNGDHPKSIALADGENPFVVEGLLWDSETGTSISIRYVDSRYFVANHEVCPKDLAGSETYTPVSYLPHRIPGVKGLKFVRHWEKTQDPLCEGMDTLQLKANIFVGFEK